MKNKKINDKSNTSSKLKPKDELVHLINNLNSAIKLYYNSTINIILNFKKNVLNKNKKNDLINIENNLQIFIKDAKYLFNRMKIVRKQSLIEEEKNKKNQGQLYNYCNNNFFYYSNAPTNVKTNPNYFTKILNYGGHHQKVIYQSPTNQSHNISKTKSDIFNFTQNSYQKFDMRKKKLLSSDNSISKEIKTKISIPKLKIETYDKDKLIENILNLLKQVNKFNYKIFYEIKEAKYIKKIFNLILSDLNKLIEVLLKENQDKPDKQCLTERKKIKSCIPNDILIGKNKNDNNLRNIKDLKHNCNSYQKINRTYNNNIISRNPINQQRYLLSIQKMKSRNNSISIQEKNMRAKSESSKDKEIFKNKIQDNSIFNKTKGNHIRDILIKEGIKEYNNIEKEKDNLILSDKEQQTENNEIKTEIINEINICIEPDQNIKLKEIEREDLIKDLENKIKSLNDDIKTLNNKILNLQKENDLYKNETENQNNQINYLNQKLILLNQYIEKKGKKSKEQEQEQEKEKDDNIIIDNNIENKNEINSINESINEETETDLDKLSIKYELLKLDFDKQKLELEEKDKLLNNYNLYRNLIDSKSSEEKINELIKKHEKEIEQLNQKYIKDILELKTNLPNCFTPSTHEILIDKKFAKYELHWYLLTITAAKNKDYENTFWVSEDEIKNMLNEFKAFKTEEDIEKENMNIYILAQQKLINRIESNEDKISNLKKQIQKLKGCK